MRTALEVVTLYNLEVWNKGRFDLIPELCAEQVVRHDANTVTVLELDEQIARIRHNYEELRPTFEPVILAGDDQYITLVWNVTGRDPQWKWCGIEIFRVENGKIVEVWNSPYVDGRWSQQGTLWASSGGGMAVLPTMGVTLAERGVGSGADIQVPLDSRGMATWLALAFGQPVSTDLGKGWWEHRFAPGGRRIAVSLAHVEGVDRARVLDEVSLDRLEIRWARSGLLNAAVALTGTPGTSREVAPVGQQRTLRLAECFGSFSTSQGTCARVVGASVTMDSHRADMAGEITLRFSAALEPETLCRAGPLEFGWRHEEHALRFTGHAEVSSPEGAFEDDGEIEAVFRWRAEHVTAMLRNDQAEPGLRG